MGSTKPAAKPAAKPAGSVNASRRLKAGDLFKPTQVFRLTVLLGVASCGEWGEGGLPWCMRSFFFAVGGCSRLLAL